MLTQLHDEIVEKIFLTKNSSPQAPILVLHGNINLNPVFVAKYVLIGTDCTDCL